MALKLADYKTNVHNDWCPGCGEHWFESWLIPHHDWWSSEFAQHNSLCPHCGPGRLNIWKTGFVHSLPRELLNRELRVIASTPIDNYIWRYS